MKILSWNINSVRLRQSSLKRLLKREEPDVVCLQETKVVDDLFPMSTFMPLGYEHSIIFGQKANYGVAILSKMPFVSWEKKYWCRRSDRRHVFVTFRNGIELHNIYAPAGGYIPNPDTNPKFAHKLEFFSEVTSWFQKRDVLGRSVVLVGDLNIAPLPTDVWSHKKLSRVVTHSPVEVAHLDGLARSMRWVDVIRHFVPEDKKIFTWWSYRTLDWRKANKGRRLDHAWVTPNLLSSLKTASVLERVRGWKQPSDHAPIMIQLKIRNEALK